MPVLAAVLSACGGQEGRIERSVRQASLAYPRPVEGRLSVAGRFARWDESPAAHRHDPAPFSDGEDKRVLRGSRPPLGNREPEELHRIGLLFLYHGADARAVSTLEAAAERKPSVAILSDLAAAYLALSNDDRPWLLIDAIAAATRAVEQAPSEPYAAFNLALALERMSLIHESSVAWERYLTLNDEDEWRQEASERLARLRAATTHDRWEVEKNLAVSAATAEDRVTLSRLARQFPRQIKELLEGDLLSAWADAAGTPAEGARLAAAKSVAETLAKSGERLYVDAIGVIESRAGASRVLAEGQQAYARGLALHGDCSQAMPAFERAVERLSAERSPLAWAARFQDLVCVYRRRAADAEEPLAELASELEAHPYPTLLARTEAMRGLCAMAHGAHSQAITHYERAVQLLTGSGDTDVLNLLGMLDEAYRFLGDRDRAWRYRLESLRGAVAGGDRKIRHSVLAGLARELVEQGRREAGRVVLDEMLANAQAWSEPGATVEALLRRIQLHLLNGSEDEATADIAECTRLLEQYRQSADREHLKTELMVVSAEQQLATSPTGALKTIQTALSRLDTSGDGLLLPKVLLDLARTRVALGDAAAAEGAFDRALQLYETRRKGTDDERLRISFFSTAQASFDAMIRFQALERGDARAAFVIPNSGTLPRNKLLDEGFRGLPHLDEVDRRFKALRMEQLKAPYVPTRIYFPDGVINSGAKWPGAKDGQTTPWYRSNGNASGDLPRDLSDRLKVTYQAATPINLTVTICGGDRLIVLKQKKAAASVVFRNTAKEPLSPDPVGQFDDLGYLLWYYPLGSWDTPFGGTCPDYASKDAVLLRCVRDTVYGCTYRPSAQSDNRFWPPMVKP